ncbi:MAG TPA: hypothetical protein VKY34_04230 [Xanthomarina sp.]|nr:hypothetical protein [Xanthomarina sp.]
MKTTKRLDLAIQKLYAAFHNNTLNPECCKQCAVGNILDHTDTWKHLSDSHGSLKLNYVGLVNQNFGKTFNGYSPLELLQIEAQFLKACGYQLPLHHKNKKPENPTDKEVLFLGLSAVVQFLCKLDNIPNVMDCSQLFQFQSSKIDHIRT